MIKTKTAEKIHLEISKQLSNGVSYIDALVDYSEKHNIEIETIADIIKKSPIMKEKIRAEAIKIRMVKKEKNVDSICD